MTLTLCAALLLGFCAYYRMYFGTRRLAISEGGSRYRYALFTPWALVFINAAFFCTFAWSLYLANALLGSLFDRPTDPSFYDALKLSLYNTANDFLLNLPDDVLLRDVVGVEIRRSWAVGILIWVYKTIVNFTIVAAILRYVSERRTVTRALHDARHGSGPLLPVVTFHTLPMLLRRLGGAVGRIDAVTQRRIIETLKPYRVAEVRDALLRTYHHESNPQVRAAIKDYFDHHPDYAFRLAERRVAASPARDQRQSAALGRDVRGWRRRRAAKT